MCSVGCVLFGARNVGDGRGVLTVLLVGGQLEEDAQEISLLTQQIV
jgi:hypothetical protein